MLLIFGMRTLLSVLGTGTFACPVCHADRTYRHLRRRRWFHIFWIPSIPASWLDPYVQCTSCGSAFGEAPLARPTTAGGSAVPRGNE